MLKRNSSFKNKELILIFPLNKRLNDDRMSEVYGVFDKVIKIPFDDILPHIIRFPEGLIRISRFKKNFQKIKLEKNALFFCFDIFTYSDVIVFNEAQKAKCKLIVLSAFVGKRFDRSKLVVKWHSTLVFFLYSLFLTKPIRFLNCKIKNTNLSGYKIFYGKPDYVLKIETSNSILKPKVNFFDNLPFPLNVLKDVNSEEKNKSSNFLMLVSTIHGDKYTNYWGHVRNIIRTLPQNVSVCIKDHPQAISKAQDELKEFKLKFFTKKECLELFILKNNISTILGHGSTGLITASWMSLSVFDYTNILEYNESINQYYDEYLDMGYNIKRLSSINEIKHINFSSKKLLTNNDKIISKWNYVFSNIK